MSLNKPATDAGIATARSPETPLWYLWDGGFFLVGRSDAVIPPHLHHAIQIVLAIEGEVGIRGDHGDWQMGGCVVVRPDVVHSYNPNDALSAMVFVDPESVEGTWLRTGLRDDITLVPDARLTPCVAELRRFLDRPFESLGVGDLVRHCVHALCTGAPPSRRRDARVTRVLAGIRASDDLRISIEQAAAMALLSPSRFAHLFKQQVGLPFRRYMLWRKLARAMLVIGRERSIVTAAHAADFADAAHLTRTFYQMLGIAPSLLKRGELFEVPSPFEVADGAEPNA